MRSAAKALAVVAVLMGSSVAIPQPNTVTQQPTRTEVDAAVAKLKQDPNIGAPQKSHRLRWTDPDSDSPQQPKSGNWLQWLARAVQWLAATARALLWVVGILVVGILGLYIKRLLQLRSGRATPLPGILPTHVRDLDIRPESLPDDIGSTALGLWERGEHRAALSLLYRGVLSRLAHGHHLPIRDSSTEGDCLQLAAAHLVAAPAAYVVRLIRVWQRAVYGSLDPTAEEMRALCSGFSTAVDAPAAPTVEQAA